MIRRRIHLTNAMVMGVVALEILFTPKIINYAFGIHAVGIVENARQKIATPSPI